MTFNDAVLNARSALFVPGNRPERFSKARTSGADLAILDLEDSVLEQDKSQALANVLTALETDSQGCPVVVRVNSDRLNVEIPSLINTATKNSALVAIMIPKVESPRSIPDLPQHLSFVAIIESALGMRHVFEIAAHPQISKLAFGGMDYAAELASSSPIVHDHARVQILLASVAAGKSGPWDSPSGLIHDLDGVLAEARHAKEMGFAGKLAIHPAQLESIHQAFAVSEAEIEWEKDSGHRSWCETGGWLDG